MCSKVGIVVGLMSTLCLRGGDSFTSEHGHHRCTLRRLHNGAAKYEIFDETDGRPLAVAKDAKAIAELLPCVITPWAAWLIDEQQEEIERLTSGTQMLTEIVKESQALNGQYRVRSGEVIKIVKKKWYENLKHAAYGCLGIGFAAGLAVGVGLALYFKKSR